MDRWLDVSLLDCCKIRRLVLNGKQLVRSLIVRDSLCLSFDIRSTNHEESKYS